MIEILQPEINVIPGDTPRTPPDRGWVGQGRTVITVTNETNRNNSYRIHLECLNPRWKQYWYSFIALPPDNAQAVVQNQEDVYGPNNQWVQIYVPQKQSRKIILDVKADRLPEARAGIYDLSIVAKVSIAGNRGGDWIEDATHRLEAVALMRPYYQWKFRVEPENARVGLMRRSRPYEVVIENSGNDWLYCELEPPRLQNVLIPQPETVRIAVPPPEDNRLPSVRTVPIRAATKMRQIRGSSQNVPLPIVLRRVDAPSIPPLPATAIQGPTSAQFRNAVVQRDPEQQDSQKPPSDPTLEYHPPIPATLEGCAKAIVQNIKGLIMMVIGFVLLFHLFDFMAARLIDESEVRGVALQVADISKPYEVEGKYLGKSRVLVFDASPNAAKDPLFVSEVTVKPDSQKAGGFRYFISLDKLPFKDGRIRLEARRMAFLKYLEALLPSHSANRSQVILVGHPKRTEYSLSGDPIQIGKDFTLVTPGYAADVKKVRIGSVDITQVRADGTDRVIAHAPDSYPGVNPGASVNVDVFVYGTDSETPLAKYSLPISHDAPVVMPSGAGDSPSPNTPGGATGGGTTGTTAPNKPATPGADKARKAIAQGNTGAAKQAAAQNPNDPEAQALLAIACYQNGDQAEGDAAYAKAQPAAQDSLTPPRTLIVIKLAEASKAIATNQSPDSALADAIETAKQSARDFGLPYLIAIKYYKSVKDNAMVKSLLGEAGLMPFSAEEKAALKQLSVGVS